MRFIKRLRKTCVICNRREKTIGIPRYGIYGAEGLNDYFHEKCLRDVCCEPERYPRTIVDMAIDLVDRIKESKRRVQRDKDRAEKRCNYLKEHCV